MTFDRALEVANAVLYEGYVLYPYRASAQKNQVRWQFGVLTPRVWSEAGAGEPWASQTETLLEPAADAVLQIKIRFLQAQAKLIEETDGAEGFRPVAALEVADALHLTWDEGVEQEIDAAFPIAALLGAEQTVSFEIPGGREVEPISTPAEGAAGRIVRERWPLTGLLRLSAERLPGPYGVVKLRVRLENVTPVGDLTIERAAAVRQSLVAAHLLLATTGGGFISLLEPPEWARPAAAACENLHTWPVLVGAAGQRDLILSSPIILYDYPVIAAESAGDLFDATEIDEILTLRTMTLTEEEKRHARATDRRAAAIIDRVDLMPPEMLDRLHGSIRLLNRVTGTGDEAASELTPWWDPGADPSVSPETDSLFIGGVAVAKGSRVRLRPGQRRADAQDMFLVGQIAQVEAVLTDVDDNTYLAVTLANDPAADLHQAYGRFLYFAPDEVEPLEGDP